MTNAFIALGLVMCWTKNEIKCQIWMWEMQKEVSDSVTMCSLDLAWQSALRQRLRRRSSRFFRAKTRESTSVPHPNIRRTSECTYTSRYWGDSSSHNPLLPVFPPLTQASPLLQTRCWRQRGDCFCRRSCSPHLHPADAPQHCSAADSAGTQPAHTRANNIKSGSRHEGTLLKPRNHVSRSSSLTQPEPSGQITNV